MPVRYIGRLPTQKAKTLWEICLQLRDLGVGRVVYRQRHAETWPSQKSFYRLTQVKPDVTDVNFRKGFATAHQTFRGDYLGEQQITTGQKADWILVPKGEEEEFCRITEVAEPVELPSHIDCPPLLELILKENIAAEGKEVPPRLSVPFLKEEYKLREDF